MHVNAVKLATRGREALEPSPLASTDATTSPARSAAFRTNADTFLRPSPKRDVVGAPLLVASSAPVLAASQARALPAHPITILRGDESLSALEEASQRIGDPSVLGRTQGVDFTPAQRAAIRTIMARMAPLWRCNSAPLWSIGRVTKLPDTEGVINDDIGGLHMAPNNTVFIAAGVEGMAFVRTVAHELTHALLQSQDPTRCTNYGTYDASPIVERWRDAMGWVTPDTLIPPLKPGTAEPELPVNDYAATLAIEDMAVSHALYLTDRDHLRELSPRRAVFFDAMYAALGVKPPLEIRTFPQRAPATVESGRNYLVDAE